MSAMKEGMNHVSKEEVRQTMSSMNGLREIPNDLISEILSRLQAKSVARFRCVSKNWASLFQNAYFTNLFMKRSSACPRILFTFQTDRKWFFFSTPQSLISDHNSSLVAVDNHMQVPRNYSFGVRFPVGGFLFTKGGTFEGMDPEMMICNPSTGQCICLPKARTTFSVTNFGYDHTEQQFKVLSRDTPFPNYDEEYQVLTLGTTGKEKWRRTECSIAHNTQSNAVCINGVIYYLAVDNETSKTMIVCFDVRSEKFNFIMNNGLQDIRTRSTLINYNGRLGAIKQQTSHVIDGSSTSFDLWVMDDTEEHKWSRHTHMLPPLWKKVVAETRVRVVGMIGTSEIVFSPVDSGNPFYIFHLNMERNSIKRVKIQGIGPLQGQKIYTFVNHVENLKLLV